MEFEGKRTKQSSKIRDEITEINAKEIKDQRWGDKRSKTRDTIPKAKD